jgi:hypothetical protein
VSGERRAAALARILSLPLYLAEFQFRYNNRREADIFGKAIAGPDAEAQRLARASVDCKRRQRADSIRVAIVFPTDQQAKQGPHDQNDTAYVQNSMMQTFNSLKVSQFC